MNAQRKGGNLNMQMVVVNDQRFAVEERNGNISFNLSQMARPYGRSKKPSNWLRSEEASSYINALTKVQNLRLGSLIEVRHGGRKGEAGTWTTDARIAVRFAQWLDMDFAIAVDDLVYKLLTKQATVVEPFMGVSPVVDGHKAWYCYLDVLKAIGYSTTSGSVAQRKRRYPNHFKKFFGRNFIDLDFCTFLKASREVKQLQLDLFNNEKTLSKGVYPPDFINDAYETIKKLEELS